MASKTFKVVAAGKTAAAAFEAARAAARAASTRAYCTGTIAEKASFVLAAEGYCTLSEARAIADDCLRETYPSYAKEGGPAAYLTLDTGDYLFFGWASF